MVAEILSTNWSEGPGQSTRPGSDTLNPAILGAKAGGNGAPGRVSRLGLQQTQRDQVRHAERRADRPAPHIGPGQSDRFLVDDRNGDGLLLDLLVKVAPEGGLAGRIGFAERRV